MRSNSVATLRLALLVGSLIVAAPRLACGDEWTIVVGQNSGAAAAQTMLPQSADLTSTLATNAELADRIPISGQLVAQSDDSILIESPDQRRWLVPRTQLLAHSKSEQLPPLNREQLATALTEQFPRHKIVHTEHYIICHDASSEHARQSARLLEQVYRGYRDFCQDLGFPVVEPKFQLQVLLFSDSKDFSERMQRELGGQAAGIVAYYHLASNQVSVSADSRHKAFLSDYVVAPHMPLDSRTILATHLVHEATHQLMCNTGMQSRMSEYPLWVSEGIAAYFEPADAFARTGWKRPGGLNSIRFQQLKERLDSSAPVDLRALIQSDDAFRQGAASGQSYSLAWGFNYFLLRRHRAEFSAYLNQLARKQPLIKPTPEERFTEFQSCFDDHFLTLEHEFVEFVKGL